MARKGIGMNMNLTANQISKQYKDKKALNGVNLTLEQGKIYGLVGRNGAGKTTLLSILSAQNPATSGEVMLGTERVWENQKALDQICFSRELNTSAGSTTAAMKVKQYLKVAAMYYPNWDAEMAKHLLEVFEIDSKKQIIKLSKGMQSMVTIIVAMASKAAYTFMDEPTSGIDVVMREQFYKILLQEYTDTGRTFVISTHIIEEAADVFEEVIIVKNGELLLKENTQELVDRTCHVSGKAEDVDAATQGLEVHHVETMGRSKGVTVLLHENQQVNTTYDVSVQPVSLQNVFVALCGNEA